MPRAAERPRLPRKHFRNKWNKITVRRSLLSRSLSARRRRAHEHGIKCMATISPDRHLILCRHRQYKVLGWVVKSLKLQFNYCITLKSNENNILFYNYSLILFVNWKYYILILHIILIYVANTFFIIKKSL